MRIVYLSLFAATAGCVEFIGDKGNIGFRSNLAAAGDHWTPEFAIANGTIAIFEAEKLLRTTPSSTEDSLSVFGRAKRGLQEVYSEENKLAVTGNDSRGVVHFSGDASDKFAVRFTQPTSLSFHDPTTATIEDPWVFPDTFGIAEGSTLDVTATLHDINGETLGYHLDDLTLTEGAIVQPKPEENSTFSLFGHGSSSQVIESAHLDHPLTGPLVHTVDPQDVVSIEIDTFITDFGSHEHILFVRVVGQTHEGLTVYGLDSDISWSGTGQIHQYGNGNAMIDVSNAQSSQGQLIITLDALEVREDISLPVPSTD